MAKFIFAFVVFLSAFPAQGEWKIDLSRRSRSSRETDLRDAGQPDARTDARTDAEGSKRFPASNSASDVGNAGDAGEDDPARKSKGIFDALFDAGEPVQELVIINTEKGFVPSTVRVRKGGRYMIHVVNVNEKEKNVSFILDGFSEHHATYYGKLKSFRLEPRKEGVYSFQSPETSAEGRLIVFNPEISIRAPAAAATSSSASAFFGEPSKEKESGKSPPVREP